MKKLLVLVTMVLSNFAMAADVAALTKLFQDNFNEFYKPRLCGVNTGRLIEEAKAANIDLTNAYALKIVGGGFLETSGFYTRTNPNERAMLGYFHYILVADNMVFDFDLKEPLVLSLEDYVRLQFTPSKDSKDSISRGYKTEFELRGWTVTRFEWEEYNRTSKPNATWVKKLSEIVDVNDVLSRDRLR